MVSKILKEVGRGRGHLHVTYLYLLVTGGDVLHALHSSVLIQLTLFVYKIVSLILHDFLYFVINIKSCVEMMSQRQIKYLHSTPARRLRHKFVKKDKKNPIIILYSPSHFGCNLSWSPFQPRPGPFIILLKTIGNRLYVSL